MDAPNHMMPSPVRHGDSRHGTPALPPAASHRGPAAEPRELLGAPRQSDPTIAALLRVVSAQRAAQDADGHEELDRVAVHWTADEVDELTDRLAESVRDVRRLRAQVEWAERELRRFRDRTRRLANALGACSSCWGEDAGCPDCHGRGRPGGAMPDETLFAELVTPVVRLVHCSERDGAAVRRS